MHLRYLQSLIDAAPSGGINKVSTMAFSPDNMRLAVCVERSVYFFDEAGEKRDKFSTKPVDSKYGKKSYVITGVAFSPDSSRLAIAQSDNVVFVYKIGNNWGDKKSISTKFIVTSSVTCLIWPQQEALFFGLAEGKVRMGNMRSGKSSTVYNVNSFTISLTANGRGSGIMSSHADGKIVRYILNDQDVHTSEVNGNLAVHSCPVTALAWTPNGYFCAGSDKRVIVYGKNGKELQRFEYSDSEKDFTAAAVSPSGQSRVLGSFARFRLFTWSSRQAQWLESDPKDIENLYTVTAMSWKPDGSKLAAGTLLGGVALFDCSLKRQIYRNRFEITYVGLSQAIIKDLSSGRRMVLKSNYGYEVEDVKILGQEMRYIVSHTQNTLLLGDLMTARLSEIEWKGSGNERYSFDNANVCVIFNAGELSLVEYGAEEILECVRTEHMSRNLISARVGERKSNIRMLAYLADPKSVIINDLNTRQTIANISHDNRFDWLELNEKATKLLFRDRRYRLWIHDLTASKTVMLLGNCTYSQWVPGSDVVVAQNRNQVSVWYNIDDVDRMINIAIKGDVTGIERSGSRTDILVQEGAFMNKYKLDEELIEFGTAVEDGDLGRACEYLESLPDGHAGGAIMWSTLAKLALEAENVDIALRSYGYLGDVAKIRYLHRVQVESIFYEEETSRPRSDCMKARAMMAQLNGNYSLAEQFYTEESHNDEAIEM